MSAGWNEEVTDCCSAPFVWAGNNRAFKRCPNCGGGDIFWEVSTHFVYHPSDYEKSLEERIEILERKVLRK